MANKKRQKKTPVIVAKQQQQQKQPYGNVYGNVYNGSKLSSANQQKKDAFIWKAGTVIIILECILGIGILYWAATM